MSNLRKRFWLYVILLCVFVALALFFGYSFLNWDKMFSMKNMQLLHDGLLPWYHPASFWMNWFTNWYIEATGNSDPGAVGEAMGGAIQFGLATCFLFSEGFFVMSICEIYRKFRAPKRSAKVGLSKALKRPWFVTFGAFIITLFFIGILFFFGYTLYHKDNSWASGIFLVLAILINLFIWPVGISWWVALKRYYWFVQLPKEDQDF
jgi:FtsH-binding integral membrane protein